MNALTVTTFDKNNFLEDRSPSPSDNSNEYKNSTNSATLEELAKKEDEIQRRMMSGGHFDKRNEHQYENGLYRESADVFNAYVELAEIGDLEAIKRALFYTSYQVSEPNSPSGIPALNDLLVLKVLTIINQIAIEDILDEELKLMLRRYYRVSRYHFMRFDSLKNLKVASEHGRIVLSNSKSHTVILIDARWGITCIQSVIDISKDLSFSFAKLVWYLPIFNFVTR